MGTQNTTLCLVNSSGLNITRTTVVVDHGDNWDGPSRPDKNMGGALPNLSSRCERAEIDRGSSNGCWFTVTLEFEGGGSLRFRGNQWDVYSELRADQQVQIAEKSVQLNLHVVQRTGKDRDTYTNTYYIRQATVPDHTQWMSALLGIHKDILLNELAMPGSHDAGMYTDVTNKARTQRLNFYQQLQAGVRYFDIRVCKYGSGLWTYHGSYYGGSLQEILGHVAQFMAEGGPNGEEVVFLKFRSYAPKDQADTVGLVKSTLADYLYKAPTPPNFATTKLYTLRGKVVAVFTPAYSSLWSASDGIMPYQDYGNEDTGADTPPASDLCLGVYDSYAHWSDFSIMQRDQLGKWHNHKGKNKNYLFLLSWTLTGSTDNILDLDLLSNTANPQLPGALHSLKGHAATDGLPNIVYLDEVDAWLCAPIINLNF